MMSIMMMIFLAPTAHVNSCWFMLAFEDDNHHNPSERWLLLLLLFLMVRAREAH